MSWAQRLKRVFKASAYSAVTGKLVQLYLLKLAGTSFTGMTGRNYTARFFTLCSLFTPDCCFCLKITNWILAFASMTEGVTMTEWAIAGMMRKMLRGFMQR